MALATASKLKTVEPVLRGRKIDKYSKAILIEEDVENHKPDPEIVGKALRGLGGLRQVPL